ncbi:hypothetical protein QOT17_014171 [Balamuthia mandrillaris]
MANTTLSRHLLPLLFLVLLSTVAAGAPVDVTLGGCADCVPTLEELARRYGDNDYIQVFVEEGQYHVPSGVLFSNRDWISFVAKPDVTTPPVFIVDGDYGFVFNCAEATVNFMWLEFDSCNFTLNSQCIIQSSGSKVVFDGKGSNFIGEPLSFRLATSSSNLTITRVNTTNPINIELSSHSSFVLSYSIINHGLTFQNRLQEANLLFHHNVWKHFDLGGNGGTGTIEHRADVFGRVEKVGWEGAWRAQGCMMTSDGPLVEDGSVMLTSWTQLAHNYWKYPDDQLPPGLTQRREVLASRLGAPIWLNNSIPQVYFSDLSDQFPNGTIASFPAAGLAIYEETGRVHEQDISPLLLLRRPCVPPHDVFIMDSPAEQSPPVWVNITYDLSSNKECVRMMEEAFFPPLWGLTMAGNGATTLGWRGMDHELLNWNSDTSTLTLSLLNSIKAAQYSLNQSIHYGLPLAIYLPPTLGHRSICLQPFVGPLSDIPPPQAHNIDLQLNVTVDGVDIGKDISIPLQAFTAHLDGKDNHANMTLSLLWRSIAKVKEGSEVEMVISIKDWGYSVQIVPINRERSQCRVRVSLLHDESSASSSASSSSASSSAEEGPSIDPPDAPTASVFPDGTPNLQLVPKQHSSLQEDLRVGFHFHSITQRDKDGNVVRELLFPKSGYSSAFPDNNTAEFGVKLQGAHEEVDVSWRFVVVEEDTTFRFGNKTFVVRAGFNKWNMTISGWPSSSSELLNEGGDLPLEVKVNVTSWDGPLLPQQQPQPHVSAATALQLSQTEANVSRMRFLTEKTEMFVGLLQYSLVDGQERPAQATFQPMREEEGGNGGQWLLIRLPIGERVEYDPDVQLLVDSTHDGDGRVNWKMVVAVAVSVGAAVLVVASVVVGVVIWQRRKHAAFTASSGAVNFSGEDHTPLLDDYEG